RRLHPAAARRRQDARPGDRVDLRSGVVPQADAGRNGQAQGRRGRRNQSPTRLGRYLLGRAELARVHVQSLRRINCKKRGIAMTVRTTLNIFRSRFLCCLMAATALFGASRVLAEDAKPAPKITYAEHVQPIFREHCFTCHSQDTAKSDLALDNFAAVMRGGASGEVIEAGDPDNSRLWALVSHKETPEMPPQQPKLADAKLDLIKQ